MDTQPRSRARAGWPLLCRAALIAGALAPANLALCASEGPDNPLLRIFLTDGTALVSYGEFARVGNRVVFSMPLGASGSEPRLHLVNIAASAVDWPRTTRYQDAARYLRYAVTRGEADFAELSATVARALNEVALAAEPPRRLAIAEGVRRRVGDWPAAHYGYRQADVRQILGLLDEVVSELRAAAGAQAFDLNFVAMVDPPTAETLLPPPTPAEAIEQALTVASLTDAPAERLTLWRSVVTVLDEAGASLPSAWAARARRSALDRIAAELEVERAYSALSRSALASASASAERADVRALEKALRTVRQRDQRLGRRRPDQVSALLATIEAQLDAARRLRLARDQWVMRSASYRAYRGAVGGVMELLGRVAAALEDIKALAGPDPTNLQKLAQRVARALRELAAITPPAGLTGVHAMLVSASQLAENAVRVRREAVSSGDVRVAWDASAAASGSLMLFARARADLDALSKRPRLR